MKIRVCIALFWLLGGSGSAWTPQKWPFSPPLRPTVIRSKTPRCPTEHACPPRRTGPSLEQTMRKLVATIAFTLIMSSSLPALATDPTDFPASRRYWTIMNDTSNAKEKMVANEALLDHAVGTINTMYYDNSGGFNFVPRELYEKWRHLRDASRGTISKPLPDVPLVHLDSREGAVQGLKYLVSTLNDPFSKYLTREELYEELKGGGSDGFLGLGAVVEPPLQSAYKGPTISPNSNSKSSSLMSTTRVDNLPVITKVAPNSPAERAGLTVGDRIVTIGSNTFLGLTRKDVSRMLQTKYSAENYAGQAELTLAKPMSIENSGGREVVMGYRLSRVKLPTTTNAPYKVQDSGVLGDSIVQYKLLTESDSIFDQSSQNVGYIRLTRFSRASTTRFLSAIDYLEKQGAQSYIIDLRNNYGGIIQEAMLTASTLLRDPHAVLCYTMNSRGGFTPHDVKEYIADTRFPGYLLSSESPSVTRDQVKREYPQLLDGTSYAPASSFASLREQSQSRGIHRDATLWNVGWTTPAREEQIRLQKKIVLLINEGTASSAEVFASALHDNGRTVALVGTRTFGKGLIQHTFPMPDGGGLRLTVAEYLTPSLHHVTKVGSARYDRVTGDWVGGGLQPDVICESSKRGGIAQNVGADFCVGTALDVLEEAEALENFNVALETRTPRRPVSLVRGKRRNVSCTDQP